MPVYSLDMPTPATFATELDESAFLLEMSAALDDSDDSDEEEMQELLLLAGIEPAAKRLRQEIGEQRLSLERLRREAAEAGVTGDDVSWNVYQRFGFHLTELPIVIRALDVPMGDLPDGSHRLPRRMGGHKFTSEEAVLLLLRRFRSTDGLLDLTKETGRNISAISEIVEWMVEHIHRRCASVARAHVLP